MACKAQPKTLCHDFPFILRQSSPSIDEHNMVIGFTLSSSSSSPPVPLQFPNIQPISTSISFPNSLSFKTQFKNPSRLVLSAQKGNANVEQQQPQNNGSNGGINNDSDNDNGNDDRKTVFNLKLGDLLNPDPDNILAVGLTCVLTWASVQVLWQLAFISLAILVAALKYSFIAALLIFILISLL